MAQGRFLSRSISQSYDLAAVSLEAAFLFTWCIPHLDRDGRMPGAVVLVRSVACPMRAEFTDEAIEEALHGLVELGLVRWYRVGRKWALEFPGFQAHQRGMRYEREAPSTLPASDDPDAVPILRASSADNGGEDGGTDPDGVGSESGAAPDEVPLKSKSKSKSKSSGSSSLRSSEPGASAAVEMLKTHPGDDPPDPSSMAQFVAPIREFLWLGESPPGSWSIGRELSIVSQLLREGRTHAEVLDAIRGVRILSDRGELEHVPKGEPCTARIVSSRQQYGGLMLFDLAVHAALKEGNLT